MNIEVQKLTKLTEYSTKPLVPLFIALLTRYSDQQWMGIQEECWPKSMKIVNRQVELVLNSHDSGYYLKNISVDESLESINTREYLKNLRNQTNRAAFSLQKHLGVTHPIIRNSFWDTVGLDNLSRYFLAQQTSQIAAATVVTLQTLSADPIQEPPTFRLFVDQKNQPLTFKSLKHSSAF